MIRTTTCYSLTCDRDCDGGGWGADSEGPYHFDSETAAVDYARKSGFVIVGDLTLCESCAAEEDCQRTGHQWDDWTDGEQEGVPYRHRWCGHCNASDYDPPWNELMTLLDAARVVNGGGTL